MGPKRVVGGPAGAGIAPGAHPANDLLDKMAKTSQGASSAAEMKSDVDRHTAMVETELSAKDFAFFEQVRKAINAAIGKGIGNAGQNIAGLIGSA